MYSSAAILEYSEYAVLEISAICERESDRTRIASPGPKTADAKSASTIDGIDLRPSEMPRSIPFGKNGCI